MRAVSKDQFYKAIGNLNVHPTIVTDKYPYTSEWRMLDGQRALIGKSVGRMDGGSAVTDYFLNA